jgi:UDP-N-acetylglucosamine acyltransferase
MIHPTAVIHAKAQVSADAVIGPYAVIDEHVVLGSECRIGPHVYLTGHTLIGRGNHFHAGCVIGDLPQDIRFKNEVTELRIAENNTFREHVTIHRSNKAGEATVIGSNNFLMAGSHVGHNSMLGDHVIIANGALLAGHVSVADRVFISATCLVHQFVRIGTLAFMQGGAGVSKDLPPYTLATGNNIICGLNTVGLRRAGLSSKERLELRKLYHFVFRGGKRFREAIAEARTIFQGPTSKVLLDFLESSTRGVVSDKGRKRPASGETSPDHLV